MCFPSHDLGLQYNLFQAAVIHVSAESLAEKFTDLCDSAKSLSEVENELTNISSQMGKKSADKENIATKFTPEQGNQVKTLLDKLDEQSDSESTERVITCKEKVYATLSEIKTEKESEPFYASIVESGVIHKAAEDIKEAFPQYRENKVSALGRLIYRRFNK